MADLPEKLYYSISEVAERFGVNASLLRFWEKEFELKPRKNSRGNRIYTREDITELERIYHLVKEKGMTLTGAKDMLSKKKGNPVDKDMETVKVLKDLRSFLSDLKSDLDQ